MRRPVSHSTARLDSALRRAEANAAGGASWPATVLGLLQIELGRTEQGRETLRGSLLMPDRNLAHHYSRAALANGNKPIAFRVFSASPAVNHLAAEGLAGAWGRRFRLPTIFSRLLREAPPWRRLTALRRPCPAGSGGCRSATRRLRPGRSDRWSCRVRPTCTPP